MIIKRLPDGRIDRPAYNFSKPANDNPRGIVCDSSKLRTTASLLDIIAGRVQGELDTVNPTNYDYGTPIDPTNPDSEAAIDGLHPHIYRVDPAQLDHYASALRASVESRQTPQENTADPVGSTGGSGDKPGTPGGPEGSSGDFDS